MTFEDFDEYVSDLPAYGINSDCKRWGRSFILYNEWEETYEL